MNRLGINDLRSEAKEQEQRSEIWEELFLYLVCIKTTYQAIAIDKDNFTKYQFVEAFFKEIYYNEATMHRYFTMGITKKFS